MGAESNKQLVRATWDAVTAGQIDTFLGNLADDVTWTFFGSHRFAGTFRGKDELVAKLFAPLGEVLEDGIKVHIDTLTADGDRVVMEARGEARAKSGKRYDNHYCIVVTVRDGKVAEVREYLDTELVSAVFGRPG